jgi:hypothetical protein
MLNGHAGLVEIDSAPSRRQQLAAPRARAQCQHRDWLQRVAVERLEHGGDLAGLQAVNLAVFDFGRPMTLATLHGSSSLLTASSSAALRTRCAWPHVRGDRGAPARGDRWVSPRRTVSAEIRGHSLETANLKLSLRFRPAGHRKFKGPYGVCGPVAQFFCVKIEQNIGPNFNAKKPKPALTLVGETASPTWAEPARNLGAHGRKQWDNVMSEYAITDSGGLEMLAQACAALDRAEALRAEIDTDGAVIRLRGTIKDHPGLKHELACRAFVVRTLAKLGLNFEPVRSSSGRLGIGWQKRTPINRPPRGGKFTPAAVKAFRDGDADTLHRLLGLRPWATNPLDTFGPCT